MPDDIKQTDHDSIVTLIAEVRQITKSIDALRIDIKDIKDDIANRTTMLEEGKADKSDFDELSKDVRWLQKIGYGSLAAIGMIQFYFAYIKK